MQEFLIKMHGDVLLKQLSFCSYDVMFLSSYVCAGLHGIMRSGDVTGLAQQCVILWILI